MNPTVACGGSTDGQLMASAFSYDARDGVPAAALDELRQANRFALDFMNNYTAVMGYCIVAPEGADTIGEEFRTAVLHSRADSSLPPPTALPTPLADALAERVAR